MVKSSLIGSIPFLVLQLLALLKGLLRSIFLFQNQLTAGKITHPKSYRIFQQLKRATVDIPSTHTGGLAERELAVAGDRRDGPWTRTKSKPFLWKSIVLKEPNPFKSPLRSQGHYCKWGTLHFVMAPWLQSATNPQTMARLAEPRLN
ncbi:uncharacterized protein LOC133703990 [Populus nigra]|uniref:uncharacterized protein LOC133703990 n=1 Tax=Populus nigra TaxID=3691 RepID=UPI002B27705F|nr:uncharacterized protein LOC133703990 [Populus nigra]